MKNNDYSYEYKDEIVKKYAKYNPIIHTSSETEYNWLESDNFCGIELQNVNGDNLFIYLEDEITLVFGDWHIHYYYEDRDDYEMALDNVDNILNNKECTIIIYSNNNWFGSGSQLNKDKFTKKEAFDFLKSFFDKEGFKEFSKSFKKYGVSIKVNYWNKDNNYEIFIEKEMFL